MQTDDFCKVGWKLNIGFFGNFAQLRPEPYKTGLHTHLQPHMSSVTNPTQSQIRPVPCTSAIFRRNRQLTRLKSLKAICQSVRRTTRRTAIKFYVLVVPPRTVTIESNIFVALGITRFSWRIFSLIIRAIDR